MEKILKRKREKSFNKRWTDNEIQQLLEYLQEHPELEVNLIFLSV